MRYHFWPPPGFCRTPGAYTSQTEVLCALRRRKAHAHAEAQVRQPEVAPPRPGHKKRPRSTPDGAPAARREHAAAPGAGGMQGAAAAAQPGHALVQAPRTPALPNGTAAADHRACRQAQEQLELEKVGLERQVARLQSERAAAEAKLHAARQEIAKLKAGGAAQVAAAAPAGNEPGQEGAQSILKVIIMANSNPAVKRDLLQALGVRSV